ncbi:tyrosine-type recombinase/integrase [Paenibacillus solani]|uniref:tyrosine-type recombinase/integrase n=1 Tax=Paenibacillus solani TaxID=1705565 RepID=UPI003D2C9354
MAKGSIEKRGERTWRLTIDLGTHADGTRNRQRKTITVEDDSLLKTTKRLRDYLNDELAQFKQEVLSGNYITPSGMTFKDFFVNEWQPKFAALTLKRTTYLSHCSKITHHVLPTVGHLRLDEITTMMMVDLFAKMRKPGSRADGKKDEPIKSRTIQYTFDVTNSIFKRAVEWRVISRNPLEGIKRPQVSKEDKKAWKDRKNFFEDEEAEHVIGALLKSDTPWRLYFLGAILGGFRRGELIALTEDDIDFTENRIRVDENISHTEGGQAVVTDAKNEASDDYVYMPGWYMADLKTHVKKMRRLKLEMKAKDKWLGGEKNYVFHSGSGKPYYHTTPSQRWTEWCKKNGFRNVSLHGLRHTNATYLLSQGASIKEIQQQLRHSTPQITTQTYTHVTKKMSHRTASHWDSFDPKIRPQSVPNNKKGS